MTCQRKNLKYIFLLQGIWVKNVLHRRNGSSSTKTCHAPDLVITSWRLLLGTAVRRRVYVQKPVCACLCVCVANIVPSCCFAPVGKECDIKPMYAGSCTLNVLLFSA